MIIRVLLRLSASLLLCAPALSFGQIAFDYSLSGETSLVGTPGTCMDFSLDVLVTATGLTGDDDGAEGFSMGILAVGCSVVDIAVDTETLDEAVLLVLQAEVTDSGAVLAAAVDQTFARLFSSADTPHRVATLVLRGVVPEDTDCEACSVRFVDGIQVSGQPVRNLVTYDGRTITPSATESIVSLCRADAGPTPSFAYTLAGPERVDGRSGTNVDFAVEGLLETSGLQDEEGAQGFSMAMATSGCTVSDMVVDSTVITEDTTQFMQAETTATGAVLSILLDVEAGATLNPANSPHHIVTLYLTGQIPDVAECTDCRIRFLDGIQGSGAPVRNVVTYRGSTYGPSLGDMTTVLCRTAGMPEPTFRYDFAAPQIVKGKRGGSVEYTADVLLTTEGLNPGTEGAEAWSASIYCPEATVLAVDTEATASDDSRVEFVVAEAVEHGAVLAVVMGRETPRFLDPGESPHHILSLNLAGSIPETGECATYELRFLDGMQGSGKPVRNVVTCRGQSFSPILNRATVQLCDTACGEAGVQILEAGVTSQAILTGEQPSACFLFETTAEEPIVFSLTDETSSNANALYVRWGTPATAAEHDVASDAPFQTAHRLFIPAAAGTACYVLVRSTITSGENSRVQLFAFKPNVHIEEFCQRQASAGDHVHGSVTGTGFYAGLEFLLTPNDGGAPIVANDTVILSSTFAEVAFAIPSGAEGLHHLDVRDREAPSTMPPFDRVHEAIQVVPGPLQPLEVELVGAEDFRIHTPARLSLRYRNGSVDPIPWPLFEIRGPVGTRFWLADGEELYPYPLGSLPAGSVLQVLGITEGEPVGLLPPGSGGEISLIFVNDSRSVLRTEIEISVLSPNLNDEIDWENVLPPAGIGNWSGVWPILSEQFGTTWHEYHTRLVEIATRLSRRGRNAASVLQAFQQAVGEAIEKPSAAIVGRIVNTQADSQPIPNVLLYAVDTASGSVASCARSDSNGSFALEHLPGGKSCRIEAENFETGGMVVDLPADGADLVNVVVAATQSNGGGTTHSPDSCPSVDVSGVPWEPIPIPRGYCMDQIITKVHEKEVEFLTVWDPNEKRGPRGRGGRRRGRLIDPESHPTFTYFIYFENQALYANAPVRKVVVTDDQLDSGLDWSTLRLGDIKFADIIIQVDRLEASDGDCPVLLDSVPYGESWQPEIPFASTCDCEGSGCEVHTYPSGSDPAMPGAPWDVCAYVPVRYLWDVNDDGGKEERTIYVHIRTAVERDEFLYPTKITWTLETKSYPDPADPDNPLLPQDGFLLPNDPTCGCGMGYVSFTVTARENTGGDGTKIRNRATIKFDDNDPMEAVWENTVCENGPATDPEAVFPKDGSRGIGRNALLKWNADCRAETYDVYVWNEESGRPRRPSAANLSRENYRLLHPMRPDTTYYWQVVVRTDDSQETTGPTWSFTTVGEELLCPAAAEGLSPRDGACQYRKDSLRWDPVPGATSYSVIITPLDGDDSEVILLNDLQEPHVPICALHLAPRAYIWQVIALDEDCQEPDAGNASTWAWFTRCARVEARFIRGDVNGDASVNMADAVGTLMYLFQQSFDMRCEDVADFNDDGSINIADAIGTLYYLFVHGPVAPVPGTHRCGTDPTDDCLSCDWDPEEAETICLSIE